jgi:hypothetical protein
VLARVLKIEIRVFPNVFECSRVLKIAIDAHEIICLQSLIVTVTAEVAGSSPVVPAIHSKRLRECLASDKKGAESINHLSRRVAANKVFLARLFQRRTAKIPDTLSERSAQPANADVAWPPSE